MEVLGLVNIPSWLLSLGLIILSLYLYTLWKHSLWRRLGVPGPTPFPFLGCLKDSVIKGIAVYDQEVVKKYGKVVGLYLGSLPTLYITDPEIIKEVFIKESSVFTNRFTFLKQDEDVDSLITGARDEHWKFLRGTMTPTFTTGKLKSMVPMIQRCCDDFVAHIKSDNKEAVEIKSKCNGYTMDVISSTAFGLQVNSQKEKDSQFVKMCKKIITGNIFKPYFLVVMVFPFLKNILGSVMKPPLFGDGAQDFFAVVVDQLIKERKDNPNNNYRDFIQLILNAHKDKDTDKEEQTAINGQDLSAYKSRGFTDKEILMNSMIFFGAGFDTTANTLMFSLYTLATHQDIQDKLIQEVDSIVGQKPPTYEQLPQMEYLDKFLSEVLRLYAAAVRINRMAKQDITVKGVFIPKDTDVSIPISALHRDPTYWPDPEKFDPERFSEEQKASRPSYCYVPFGLGPRNCVGMRLALLEAKFALIAMVQNYKFYPCDKTEIPIKLEKGFLTRPLNDLYLKVEQRD